MRKITFVNEKGGSGKTTLSVNVGAWLADAGKKVLLVDMDPQGHVGKSLGINIHAVEKSAFDILLYPEVSIEEATIETGIKNLYLLPANKLLTDVVVNISTHSDRHLKLKKKMDEVSGYDFIIVDSPPSLGLLTVNILLAVEEVVIPVSLTYLALDGCAEIIETVNIVNQNFGHGSLRVTLVVPTFYRDSILVKSIMNKLKNHFGDKLAKTIIENDMKIDQAQSFGKSIFDFAPDSHGAKMMGLIAKEVLESV